MHNLIIRQALLQDVTPCHAIERQSFAEAEAASHARIALRQREFPRGFLVAIVKEDVVGLINSGAGNGIDLADEDFKALKGHDPEGRQRVIFSLAVSPAFREKGVATALLEAYLEKAREDQVTTIDLICKPDLIRFYEKRGFEARGQSKSTHGGVRWTEMRLTISP